MRSLVMFLILSSLMLGYLSLGIYIRGGGFQAVLVAWCEVFILVEIPVLLPLILCDIFVDGRLGMIKVLMCSAASTLILTISFCWMDYMSFLSIEAWAMLTVSAVISVLVVFSDSLAMRIWRWLKSP